MTLWVALAIIVGVLAALSIILWAVAEAHRIAAPVEPPQDDEPDEHLFI